MGRLERKLDLELIKRIETNGPQGRRSLRNLHGSSLGQNTVGQQQPADLQAATEALDVIREIGLPLRPPMEDTQPPSISTAPTNGIGSMLTEATQSNFFRQAAKPPPLPKPKPLKYPYATKYPAEKGWKYIEAPALIRHDLKCCGIKEIHGIQHSHQFYTADGAVCRYEPQTMFGLITQIKQLVLDAGRHRPFWLFSDNTADQRFAEPLVRYINEHKLGSVWQSSKELNKNSNNKICMYVWTMNETIRNHYPVPGEHDAGV